MMGIRIGAASLCVLTLLSAPILGQPNPVGVQPVTLPRLPETDTKATNFATGKSKTAAAAELPKVVPPAAATTASPLVAPLPKPAESTAVPQAPVNAKPALLTKDAKPVVTKAAASEIKPPAFILPALPMALSAEEEAPLIHDESECCTTTSPARGISAGASVYILKPYFDTNPAFITTFDPVSTAPRTEATPFDWDLSLGVAAWIGWTGAEGLGARVRFFNFDQSSASASTSNTGVDEVRAAPGLPDPLTQGGGVSLFFSPSLLPGTDLLTFNSDLRIQTLDAEGTWSLGGAKQSWLLLLSGGGRYLQSYQNYSGVLTNTGSTEFETIDFGHNFYGGGPTIAMQGRCRVRNTGLVLYGMARGALLVGTVRQTFFASQSISTNTTLFQSSEDDTLPVAELEAGLEYRLGSDVYFQVAVVDQAYFGLGSASQVDADLSLFGFQFSVGVGY